MSGNIFGHFFVFFLIALKMLNFSFCNLLIIRNECVKTRFLC